MALSCGEPGAILTMLNKLSRGTAAFMAVFFSDTLTAPGCAQQPAKLTFVSRLRGYAVLILACQRGTAACQDCLFFPSTFLFASVSHWKSVLGPVVHSGGVPFLSRCSEPFDLPPECPVTHEGPQRGFASSQRRG